MDHERGHVDRAHHDSWTLEVPLNRRSFGSSLNPDRIAHLYPKGSTDARDGSVLALFTISTPAAAQWSAVEFGMDIGRGCIGDEGGFCGDEIGTTRAAHASAWIDDRVEIGVCLAVLPLEDWNYSQERDSRFDLANDPAVRSLSRIDVAVREHSRRILNPRKRYTISHEDARCAGSSAAGLANSAIAECRPAPQPGASSYADPFHRRLAATPSRSPTSRPSPAFGAITSRAVRARRDSPAQPAGEGLSTAETFIGTSYRFRRSTSPTNPARLM